MSLHGAAGHPGGRSRSGSVIRPQGPALPSRTPCRMQVDLYVDGCDVSFDPARVDNVRANLASVQGRTYVLRPGDTGSLGPAPVVNGRDCLALPGLIDCDGAGCPADIAAGVTAVVDGAPGPWRRPPRPREWVVGLPPGASVPQWHRLGRLLAHGPDLHAMLQALVTAGLTPGEAILCATLRPGALLDADPPLGRIADGAAADWILVPGGPLRDIRALRRPRHVVIGGARVAGHG